MTNFFAYKYVMLAIMCSQINEYAPRMGLSLQTPIKPEDVRFVYIGSPISMPRYKDYGGRIIVTNWSFTFSPTYQNVYNMDEHGFISLGIPAGKHESSHSVLERASQMKYKVTTNDAYRMATNWLVALEVDVGRMESTHIPIVNREPLFKSERGWVPSPLITVDWMDPKMPGADPRTIHVVISAVTGELLKLVGGNGAFCKRGPRIKELEELMAIPDDAFLGYSTQERIGLVAKFSGITNTQDYSTNIPSKMYDNLFRSGDESQRIDRVGR